jgi:hypothetical protein
MIRNIAVCTTKCTTKTHRTHLEMEDLAKVNKQKDNGSVQYQVREIVKKLAEHPNRLIKKRHKRSKSLNNWSWRWTVSAEPIYQISQYLLLNNHQVQFSKA